MTVDDRGGDRPHTYLQPESQSTLRSCSNQNKHLHCRSRVAEKPSLFLWPTPVCTYSSGNLLSTVCDTPNISKQGHTMNIQQKELPSSCLPFLDSPPPVSTEPLAVPTQTMPASSFLLTGDTASQTSTRQSLGKGSSFVLLAVDTQGF